MKRSLFLALVLISACNNQVQNKYTSTLLRGATIYTGDGDRLENASLRIENGMIQCVGDCPEKQGDEIIDVAGKYITPGMVDAHVHYFQTGFFDSRPDAMDLRENYPTSEVYSSQAKDPWRYNKAYLGSGVTAVYDVGGMPWSIMLQQTAELRTDAPHIAAAGTLLTPAPAGRIAIFNMPTEQVMVHLDDGETGRAVVKYNSDLGSTGIKIWGMAANNESFREAMLEVRDEVEKQGNKLIIHATTLDQARMALEMGARLLVHSVDDTLVDDAFIELAKANNVYYNPTLIVGAGYYNARKAVLGEPFDLQDPRGLLDPATLSLFNTAAENATLIDTSQVRSSLSFMEEREARSRVIMATNLKALHDAGIKIVVGTDAGNPGTLHGVSIFNELEAMQDAGIPPADLIVMATKNGAEVMERSDDFGTVEIGKQADLLVLREDPGQDIAHMRSLEWTFRKGVLWDFDK